MAATYEYQAEALVLRLDGLGTPAEMHADLLRALSRALAELQNEKQPYPDKELLPLTNLLDALLPTARHLEAGGHEAQPKY